MTCEKEIDFSKSLKEIHKEVIFQGHIEKYEKRMDDLQRKEIKKRDEVSHTMTEISAEAVFLRSQKRHYPAVNIKAPYRLY